MEGYGYAYPPHFPQMGFPDGEFPDHGDGFGEYYGLGPLNGDRDIKRRSRSKQQKSRKRDTKSSRSRSRSASKSRSRSRSRTRSRSRSKSHSRSRTRSRSKTRSRSRSRTRSRSGSRKELNFREPGILDAFRVLYLTPSKHKKSATKYLATKKRQDRVQELLKSDGLGSKRWFFYPRSQNKVPIDEVPGTRDNCDQRVKVDGNFFRKYKKNNKVDSDAPIAKLKLWELVFYKKLGFIQAV